jgi:hypothetical protein
VHHLPGDSACVHGKPKSKNKTLLGHGDTGHSLLCSGPDGSSTKNKTLCTILLQFQAGDTRCVSMCTRREMSRPWRYTCTCREKSRPACVRVEKCLALGRFRLGDVLNVESVGECGIQ